MFPRKQLNIRWFWSTTIRRHCASVLKKRDRPSPASSSKCSLLSEKLPTPVRRVGVQDKFGCSGPAWDLLKEYGLDAATICKTAKEMLGK